MSHGAGFKALTRSQLRHIRSALADKILQGLAGSTAEIKALPAYLGRPCSLRSGDVVAVDVGGTAMRAGWLRVRLGSAAALRPIEEARIVGRGAASRFFERQADLVVRACPRQHIHLAYCYSYPARITPSLTGSALRLTKGVRVRHLVGRSVGAELAKALRRRGKRLGPVPVLNDTVATLLAGAFIAPGYQHYIGLVVGTGTNMAGFFPVGRIRKLTADQRRGWRDDEDMAVNLESGNFTPPHLSEHDRLLDAAAPADHPGRQRFEKAVAGAYLPRLFQRLVGERALRRAGLDPEALDTRALAELRGRRGAIGRAASAVLDRSADLVAAGLAGLIQAYGRGPKRVGVLAEGSLFWGVPGYRDRVRRQVARLRPADAIVMLRYPRPPGYPSSNLLGAACAALSLRRRPAPRTSAIRVRRPRARRGGRTA